MKKIVDITLLVILFFSMIGLTGCRKTADSDAAQAAELEKVKGLLEQTQKERDDLKAKVTEITESLKAAQAKIQTIAQAGTQTAEMQNKLAELAKDKDAEAAKAVEAQSLVEKLKSQLQAQLLKVTELQGQNQKLQEIIDQLKKQTGTNVKLPTLP